MRAFYDSLTLMVRRRFFSAVSNHESAWPFFETRPTRLLLWMRAFSRALAGACRNVIGRGTLAKAGLPIWIGFPASSQSPASDIVNG
jgi:hypothetical protein